MNSTSILAKLKESIHLTGEEEKFLLSILIPRPFRQGEIIVKSGDIARYMMFVDSGYLMTYYTDHSGTEHVLQFARDGWWSADIYSLSIDPTSIYTTRALSDGELLLLPRSAQEQLLEKHPKF